MNSIRLFFSQSLPQISRQRVAATYPGRLDLRDHPLLFDLVDGFLGPWIQWVLEQFGIDWTLPGPGIVAAVVIIYLMGAFATFKAGRAAVDWARASLLRVPLVGTIYSANRQLIESFSGTSVTGFKRVVLVEFPRTNSWSLGFLTGITNADDGKKMIMTYVPTAPLPNSGFVVLMPPEDVLDTDLSVPEAMQLIFSGGIVSPRNINTRRIDVAEVEEQIRQMGPSGQSHHAGRWKERYFSSREGHHTFSQQTQEVFGQGGSRGGRRWTWFGSHSQGCHDRHRSCD